MGWVINRKINTINEHIIRGKHQLNKDCFPFFHFFQVAFLLTKNEEYELPL